MKLKETIIVGLLIVFCFSAQAFALSDQEVFALSDPEVRAEARKELEKFSFPVPVTETVTMVSASVLATGVLYIYKIDFEFDQIASKRIVFNESFEKLLCTDVALQEFREISKNLSILVYDRNLNVVLLTKVETKNC